MYILAVAGNRAFYCGHIFFFFLMLQNQRGSHRSARSRRKIERGRTAEGHT